MSGINYKWSAQCLNDKGHPLMTVTGDTIDEVFQKQVGNVITGATARVNVSLVRIKDGMTDEVRFAKDAESGSVKPLGRFTKHNATVPVTKVRELAEAIA